VCIKGCKRLNIYLVDELRLLSLGYSLITQLMCTTKSNFSWNFYESSSTYNCNYFDFYGSSYFILWLLKVSINNNLRNGFNVFLWYFGFSINYWSLEIIWGKINKIFKDLHSFCFEFNTNCCWCIHW